MKEVDSHTRRQIGAEISGVSFEEGFLEIGPLSVGIWGLEGKVL